MKKIFTLTLSPAIDKSSSIEHVLPEHKLRCAPPKYEPGGGGINVSRAIKKLGGESVAVYPKGGPTGELLQKLLSDENITQHPIPVTSWNRENFIIVETSTNRQFRFGMPGSELLESEWKKCLEDLSKKAETIDYLVASGSRPPGVPAEFYRQLAKIAKDKNAKLILDTSGDALKEAVKEGIYLLKPNLKELSELVGKELRSSADQEDAALNIIDQGKIEILVVSLGASGAMLASKDGVFHVSAPSVAKKSTVGAGDSMVAGIVLSLSKGWNPADALRYGIASGTAATMNPGTELCKLEDVETLYKWIKSTAEKRPVRI
jgi:6-phosphofructokinase 2